MDVVSHVFDPVWKFGRVWLLMTSAVFGAVCELPAVVPTSTITIHSIAVADIRKRWMTEYYTAAALETAELTYSRTHSQHP